MLYASYESNISKEQMALKCPNSKVMCNGKLKGWKLVVDEYSNVIKTNKENDEVSVVVWNIADEDWYKLDTFGKFSSGYTKKVTDVILDDERIKKAIVYVLTNKK